MLSHLISRGRRSVGVRWSAASGLSPVRFLLFRTATPVHAPSGSRRLLQDGPGAGVDGASGARAVAFLCHRPGRPDQR
jgi:hypothetical protein